MRLLTLFVSFLVILSCQELPEKYKGEEGKKLLEKYRNQFVAGTVVVDESLKGKVPKERHFLIIAVKKKDNPMPVAVLRVTNPKFPFKFKITGKNKISQDRFIEGELILTARISRSPGAQAQVGDLLGTANVKAGEIGVLVKINEEVR